jgi:hypothetical protein
MVSNELRAQIASSVLNSLLETTKHSVIGCLALKDVYADVAVLYADALIKSLEKNSINEKEVLEKLKEKL